VDPNDLEYRRATRADAPRMAALVAEGWETYRAFGPPGWEPPTAEDETAFAERVLAMPSGWGLLAEDGSAQLAGHVGWHAGSDGRRPADEPGLAHLWQLFVRRDWWGSGLAAKLQAAGLQAAVDSGFQTIRLFTPADHGRGRRSMSARGGRCRSSRFSTRRSA